MNLVGSPNIHILLTLSDRKNSAYKANWQEEVWEIFWQGAFSEL